MQAYYKPSEKVKGDIQNIQGARGIAALFVVLAHLGPLSGQLGGTFLPWQDLGWMVYGVDIFFVLSGFIMYHVTSRNWGDIKGFAFRRAARIFPMYWICSHFALPLFYVIYRLSQGDYIEPGKLSYYLLSWFLIPVTDPVRHEIYPPLYVGWTLSYEMFFYLVLVLLQRCDRKWFVSGLCSIFSILFLSSFALEDGSAAKQFLGNPIYFEFVAGCYLAKQFDVRPRLFQAISPAVAVTLMVASAVLASIHIDLPRVFHFGAAAVLFFIGIVSLELRNVFAPKFLQKIGDSSYSLYLCHGLVITPILMLLRESADFASSDVVLLSVFCCTVAFSYVVHVIVERPIALLVHRIWVKRRSVIST